MSNEPKFSASVDEIFGLGEGLLIIGKEFNGFDRINERAGSS